MSYFITFALGAFFVSGCALEESKQNKRNAESWVADDTQQENKSADANSDKASGNSDEGSKPNAETYGEGRSMVQVASTIPKCGQSYTASYKGSSKHEKQFQDGNKVRSFDMSIASTLKLSGDKLVAKMNISNEVVVNAATGISKSTLIKEANVLAGDREYTFISDDALAALKQDHELWAKVKCAILPASKATFHYQGIKRLVTFEPALPSLLTPNAALEIYKEDIGNGIKFTKIKATVSGQFKIETDANGQAKETFVPFETPVVKEIDVEIKIIKEDGDKLTLEMSTIESGTSRSIQGDTVLLEQGLIPKSTLNIDTSIRRNRDIALQLPYKAGQQYFYSTEIQLKKLGE